MIALNQGQGFPTRVLSCVAGGVRMMAVVAVALLGCATVDAKVIYVNAKHDNTGDGTSWKNAFKYLQPALRNATPGDSIYMAKGTYYPDDGVANGYGDREISFELNQLSIYGGFAGDEKELKDRKVKANPTILSGGIWDVTAETPGYERYWSLHVVKVNGSSILDGLIVEKGRASGETAPFNQGGGCLVASGQKVTLKNCIFRMNMAAQSGGAIWGTVIADNCEFYKNFINNEFNFNSDKNRIRHWLFGEVSSGGAIQGDVTATNCQFTKNYLNIQSLDLGTTCSATGGAITGNKIKLDDCLFDGNKAHAFSTYFFQTGSSATTRGGAVSGTVTATRCTFVNNRADALSHADTSPGTDPKKIGHYQANPSSYGGAIAGQVTLMNCVFDRNTAIATGGNIKFFPDFPGDQAAFNVLGSAVYMENECTVANSLFNKNDSEKVDNTLFRNAPGAFYSYTRGALHVDTTAALVVSNSTFMDNLSTGVGAAISCAGKVNILSNVMWFSGNESSPDYYDLAYLVDIGGRGRISNRLYPTPSTETINVVKGGFSSVTSALGANVDFGQPAERTFIDLNPRFVNMNDPIGPDGIWGTGDDGLRLTSDSPAIGKGLLAFLSADIADLDGDGDVGEAIPDDFAGFVRVQGGSLDLGAYEFGDKVNSPNIEVKYGGASLTPGVSVVDLSDVAAISRIFIIKNTGNKILKNISVTGSGPNIGAFEFTQPLVSALNTGASTTFTVTFAPNKTDVLNATLHVNSNDPKKNPFDINLQGQAQLPDIAVEYPDGKDLTDGSSQVNFGPTGSLLSSTRSFTIRNRGLGNLSIQSVTSSGPDAAKFVPSAPVSNFLIPGASTTFDVTFAPGNAGIQNASITILSNDPDAESSFLIKVTGKGVDAPEIFVSQPFSTEIADGDSSDFGMVERNLLYSKTFIIKNSGAGDLRNLAVSLSGANAFSKTALSVNRIRPGKSARFEVTFMPDSLGDKSAKLVITSNDPDESSISILLVGKGIANSFSPQFAGFATTAFSPAPSADGDKMGQATVTKASDGLRYLTLTVEKTEGWDAANHQVEVSSTLVDWYSGDKFTTTLVDSPKLLQVRDNVPVKTGVKRYIRVK